MILIDTDTLALREFPNSDQHYAILSHTWGTSSDEVTKDYYARAQRARIRNAHAEHHISDLKNEAVQRHIVAQY
jgi:hypothetical protein